MALLPPGLQAKLSAFSAPELARALEQAILLRPPRLASSQPSTPKKLETMSPDVFGGGRTSPRMLGALDLDSGKRKNDPTALADDDVSFAQQDVLGIDIGGTRTKFIIRIGGSVQTLPPKLSSELWQDAQSNNDDKFDPMQAATKIKQYLQQFPQLRCESIRHVVFSVPGTVDLSSVESDEVHVVKNMPSFSPKFRGFDFKLHFRPIFPNAKISAIADNMAAAIGVAYTRRDLYNSLVLVLGTAPAVATFFRPNDPFRAKSGKPDTYLETGIWQSWVWFSKIDLDDQYGYCGGLKVEDNGRTITLKPPTACKIPHHQARIRFALDDPTWKRLQGKHVQLPPESQANLSKEDATSVWIKRVQAAVNVLAHNFHLIYGPCDSMYVLGGNATRVHGSVTTASYVIPDSTKKLEHKVKVVIPESDIEQQEIHMSGLLYSIEFKVKHVFAPGQDPLARGWTRGGEIYVWLKREKATRSSSANALDLATDPPSHF